MAHGYNVLSIQRTNRRSPQVYVVTRFDCSRKDDPKYLDTGRTNTRARDAALVKVIPPKSTVFERSVLYKGAIEWNNLDVGSRSIVNKTMFKAHQTRWLKGSVTLS